MNLKSIRWRLPLSYAAIALLAALSLGSVMLLVLNGYYTRQERDYLLGNAVSLQPMVEQTLQTHVPPKSLQEMVNNLSFLSQTRIRVLDAHGIPLVDSGVPDPNQMVSISSGMNSSILLSEPANIPPDTVIGTAPQIPLTSGTGPAEIMPDTVTATSGGNTVLILSASPYGYSFVPAPSSSNGNRRSAQVISLPLSNSLGTLEISKGPAYGQDILGSVILAWAGAGVVAVLLAALAGWVASHQVIHPVLALTNVTQRMEGGDLSVRVKLLEKRPATEFQALANAFNGMAQRVENTVSTLRAFVADAAHELNTPITALRTDLELARTTVDAGERARLLERIEGQIIRLQGLVRSLLDLSRLEGKTSAPIRQQVDLAQLAQSLAEVYASRAEQAEINFELDLPGDPVILSGDPAQLRAALENLLDNALKFTPSAGTVCLRLADENAQVILRVEDTGIGIPDDDLPSLFQRFHRGRNASAYPGNGLGLTIVDQIARLHGGSVTAENTSPGVRFILCLPAGLSHSAALTLKG